MEMGRLLTGIYSLCKWITHFAYLNLLWLGFTLFGGVIFGIFPSTIAMFTVARRSNRGEEGFSVFKLFLQTYRKEFLPINGLGWSLVAIGLVWFFDLHFFRGFDGMFYSVMNYLMVVIGVIYIVLLIYIFPVYVHYELKLYQYIKQTVMVAFLSPANLFLMIVGTLGIYYFYISFPAFIPLFGLSIIVYFNMYVAFKCFQSIENGTIQVKTAER